MVREGMREVFYVIEDNFGGGFVGVCWDSFSIEGKVLNFGNEENREGLGILVEEFMVFFFRI